jgi:hypothetical protein
MQAAGIKPGVENETNVSFADPLRPIFIEPKISSKTAMRIYINQKIRDPKKREELFELLSKINLPEKSDAIKPFA